MGKKSRIQLSKYQFAELISEVNGLCPLCSEELLTLKDSRQAALSQAAHIYPHSPSEEEVKLLDGLPKLASDDESIENLIMLCPNCHYKFDHPRTREGYMQLYKLKQQLLKRKAAQAYYHKHSLESDLVCILQSVCNVNTSIDQRKLSYQAIAVETKMRGNASNAVKNVVIRDVRDYYIPIQESLIQLEHDSPGKSDLIAKEISLFYSELQAQMFSQDDIYYAINDWLDSKTQYQYKLATPFITAFYIQDCEVFS